MEKALAAFLFLTTINVLTLNNTVLAFPRPQLPASCTQKQIKRQLKTEVSPKKSRILYFLEDIVIKKIMFVND